MVVAATHPDGTQDRNRNLTGILEFDAPDALLGGDETRS
jgi:hypothetical protein